MRDAAERLTLDDALIAALAERGSRAGAAVVVGHPDDPVVVADGRTTGRVVAAAGAGARLLVGCGVAAAGTTAVVLAEAGTMPPRDPDGRVTAVLRDARAAETLRRAGWTVAQPVWPADVEGVLAAAADGDDPVVLLLHTRALAPPRQGVPPPILGRPRVLAEGRTGVVVAAGALVADVQAVLAGLRAKGLDLALVDAHTRRAQTVRPPLAEPDSHVLVGGPQAARALAAGQLRAGTLQTVDVPDGADVERLLADRVPLHG